VTSETQRSLRRHPKFEVRSSKFEVPPSRSEGGWLAQPKLAIFASEGWRARQDSNLRPLAPEANALSS
jgi:hypothetical protein